MSSKATTSQAKNTVDDVLYYTAVSIVVLLVIMLIWYYFSQPTTCQLRYEQPVQMTPCQRAAMQRYAQAAVEQTDQGVWDKENSIAGREGYKPEPGMGSVTEGLWGASPSHGEMPWDVETPDSITAKAAKTNGISTAHATHLRYNRNDN